MKDNFFVIIPAYNEERYIGKVITGVKKYAKNIIVVDDGSKDNTYKIAKKSGALVLKHLINLGKGAALKTGCEAAIKLGAKNLILMDADLQHNPSDITFLKKGLIKNKNVLVLGYRKRDKKKFYFRLFGSFLISFLIKIIFKKKIYDPLCGFRAFSKEIYKKINWVSSGYSVELEIVFKALKKKIKILQVPICTVYLDKYKGFSLFDGIRLLIDSFSWLKN